MIDAIHQSSLNTILRCPEQFRRRYLEGEIIPPGIAAGRGTGVHKANDVNLSQKIVSKIDLPVDDLKDAARDGFVESFKNGIYLAKEEVASKTKILNEGLNDTLRLTELYHSEVAPEIVPIEVEKEFLVQLDGVPLPIAGRMDIEQEAKVDDLKTATKSWSEGRINQEIQPIVYSLAHLQLTGTLPLFTYHILVALKASTKRQIQSTHVSDKQIQALRFTLITFCKALDAGVFLPANPAEWYCDEKW
ncbi:MAG: PD-(D/E)XK nuclease family protein [Candidatus Margulisiibacteriota bacterium]